ncbi:hypothetical protein ABT024_21260 [Streptomyces sp. NPDC002812]|uniref:hypothetical protein n=1 Tax=Streptomyces sp. NPDC002812 TaxID=3154434 RepID=UPI003327D715
MSSTSRARRRGGWRAFAGLARAHRALLGLSRVGLWEQALAALPADATAPR